MNCLRCGRFMQKHLINDDPENLEDEVWRWWYCTTCKEWRTEHLYFKSEMMESVTDTGILFNEKDEVTLFGNKFNCLKSFMIFKCDINNNKVLMYNADEADYEWLGFKELSERKLISLKE